MSLSDSAKFKHRDEMPSMKIIEIDRYDDFLSLEKRWNKLLERCTHTVFSTWEWLSTWWKHFGNDKRLMLLLAEENDKIIGIAPLMYSVHRMFRVRMGKIEFIGTPDSDYHDFILTEKSEECLKLFIDYLSNLPEKWNCIQLTDIPENAKCIPILSKISKNLKLVHKCPCVPLPKSYDTFMLGLSRNFRKDLRNNLRRLKRDFKVDFFDCSEIQSYAEGMNWLFQLHKKRWQSKGLSGAFANQKFRSFHLDIARSFSKKGWLGLLLLRLSGEPAVVSYGFKYRSKYYSYLSGFDPKYSRYGVGNLIKAYIIGKCIEEGLAGFDFMRGVESYKDRWNTITRWNRQAVITKRGFLANVQNWLYREYWRQGNRLKYLLKMQ